jgi:hypothetical protein
MPKDVRQWQPDDRHAVVHRINKLTAACLWKKGTENVRLNFC